VEGAEAPARIVVETPEEPERKLGIGPRGTPLPRMFHIHCLQEISPDRYGTSTAVGRLIIGGADEVPV